MINYKLVKTTINVVKIAKVIKNIVIRCYYFLNFIWDNKNAIFISKFSLILFYFMSLK